MALLSTGKIIASIATIGVGGSAGAGTYFFLTSGTTIEELIKTDTKKTRTIISMLNKDSLGDEAGKKYKQANATKKKGQDSGKLVDWVDNGQGLLEHMPDSLANECTKRKDQKLKDRDNEDYKSFISGCTKETE